MSRRDWPGYVDQKNYAAEPAVARLDFLARRRRARAAAAGRRNPGAARPATRRCAATACPRVTFHLGRWIRTTDFYPDYQTRLYDRRAARWRGKYVHESVAVDGPVGRFRHDLEHYSFRDLRDQLDRVNHYTTLAARQMHEAGRRAGLFDLAVHPPAAFLRNYVLRRGILDGTAGLTISLVNAYSVFLKFAKLWELQRTPRSQRPNAQKSP